MTRDEFESRYRLLQEVTRAGGATTHNAIGPAGAVVMVHFLREELLDPVRSLVALPKSDRPDRILTLLDVDGAPVLVTKFIMDFPDLASWLGGAPDRAEPNEPGDFTAMFGAADPSVPAAGERESEAEGGAEPKPEAEAEGPPADAVRPGEFTALFRAAGGDAPASHDVPESHDVPDSPERSADPEVRVEPDRRDEEPAEDAPDEPAGEFTRLFGAVDPVAPPRSEEPLATEPPAEEVPPEPPRPSPAPPPKDRPSDPFETPEPRYGVPDHRELPGPQPPPEPGGLTARFAAPSPDRPPGDEAGGSRRGWPPMSVDSTPDHTVSDDYLERLHASSPPSASQTPPLGTPPTPAPGPTPPPAPPEDRGPGAYTRVIAGVQPPSARPPSTSPASSPLPEQGRPEDEKRHSVVPFLLVMSLIVVLAVGLVIGYVVLSNRA
jgi:hypothetical protein